LVLAGSSVPGLTVVFPVDIVLAVEGGNVIETLRERGETAMVAQHCITFESWSEAPVSPNVLRIVDKILSDDSGVRVSKHSFKRSDDSIFFLLGPVSTGVFDAHEGDAD
jgi:hypothetical protein